MKCWAKHNAIVHLNKVPKFYEIYQPNIIKQKPSNMQTLVTQDYLVFFAYFVIIVGYGFWIYNRKK